MSEKKTSVLIVEDDPHHVALIEALIAEVQGARVRTDLASTRAETMARFADGQYDVCLLDYKLVDIDGLTLLRCLRESGISTPVVFLTSMGNEDIAVEAMKAGASDYIRKENLSGELLWAAMRYAMELQREEERRKQAEAALREAKEELEVRVQERTAELRMANEELLGAYQALKEADRLKNEMIQNVSHEFRTPLSYLVGYTGMMLEDVQRDGPLTAEEQAQFKSYMTHLMRAADRLTHLIENFTAIQSLDNRELQPEPTSLAPVVVEAIEGASLKADNLQINLSKDLVPDLPLVLADSTVLGQVLDNLIANAFKFTEAGGQVMVRAWADQPNETVYVSVSDTGIGIPPEQQERIFERFYQIDGSSTREYGGVGLGLAVCKEIVEALGGSIWVESKIGEGTTFTFTLPVATQESNERQPVTGQ
jgi:signal transduction histidine kinase